jgi:hypothetical protein
LLLLIELLDVPGASADIFPTNLFYIPKNSSLKAIGSFISATMRLNFLLVATMAVVACAAPTKTVYDDVYNFSPSLAEFYSKVSQYIDKFADGALPSCDVSKVALPAQASGLPSPSNQTLKYVAIGRGTQVRLITNFHFGGHV